MTNDKRYLRALELHHLGPTELTLRQFGVVDLPDSPVGH